jgi:YgiT-type zinc finger domain-containing protein
MKPYGDCMYCGGEVVERSTRVDYRLKDELYILENVPTGVCCQCGEQFFTAETAKRMESAVTQGRDKLRTVAVPVIAVG